MKYSILRKLIGGASLTSALFIFQACYGTGPELEDQVYIEGVVKCSETDSALTGITVSILDKNQSVITDDYGFFNFYTFKSDSISVIFEDQDSLRNNQYLSKDTIISGRDNSYNFIIRLDKK